MSESIASTEPRPNLRDYLLTELHLLKKFLQSPARGHKKHLSRSDYWKRILFLFALDLIISGSILCVLKQFPVFSGLEFKHDYKDVLLCLFAVFIGPPIEELVFRIGLRNFRYSLLIGPLIIAVFVASGWVPIILAAVLLIEGIYLQVKLVRSSTSNPGWSFGIRRQFIQSYQWVFWLYAISFSIVHIGNYNFSKLGDWVVIFVVSPQLFSGLLWGYARLRMNLFASIILHIIHNGVFVLIARSF